MGNALRTPGGEIYKEIIAVGSRNDFYSRVVYKNKDGFQMPVWDASTGSYSTDYVSIKPTDQKITALKRCKISAVIANGPEVGEQHKQDEIPERIAEPGEVVYSFSGDASNYFGILILIR